MKKLSDLSLAILVAWAPHGGLNGVVSFEEARDEHLKPAHELLGAVRNKIGNVMPEMKRLAGNTILERMKHCRAITMHIGRTPFVVPTDGNPIREILADLNREILDLCTEAGLIETELDHFMLAIRKFVINELKTE